MELSEDTPGCGKQLPVVCTAYIHRVLAEQISRYGSAKTGLSQRLSLCNVCRMSGLHRHLLIPDVQLSSS